MNKDKYLGEPRPEYDFGEMSGGVQRKYAQAYRRGTNLVRLNPDVAEAYSTDEAVNEALRAILRVAPKTKTASKTAPAAESGPSQS